MKVTTIRAALALCKHSLMTLDFDQTMTDFCFTGKQVQTYNGITKTAVPLASEFQGGLRGDVLMGLLATVPDTKELTFERGDGEELIVRAGRMRVAMPLTPISEFKNFALDADERSKKEWLPITEKTLDAFARAAKTTTENALHRWLMGVTATTTKEGAVTLYASNGACLTRETLEADGKPIKETLLIPNVFCDQLVTLGANLPKEGARLFTTKSGVLAEFGDVKLYTNLMADKPQDYRNDLAQLLGDKAVWRTGLPFDRIRSALDRQQIVLAKSSIKNSVWTAEGDSLTIEATSDVGHTRDVFKVKDKLPFAKTSLVLDPSMCLLVLEHAERIALTKNYLAATGKKNRHLRITAGRAE